MRIYENMTIDAADGPCGRVVDVLIDRRQLTLSDLVVSRPGSPSVSHLVPVSALDGAAERLTLTWTADRVDEAPPVHEAALVDLGAPPPPHEGEEIGVIRVFAHPDRPQDGTAGPTAHVMDYDVIPAGTAEIRHASEVRTSDDRLAGHVAGLVVSPPQYAVSGLIVEHRHLLGHRQVTLPVHLVASVETDLIRLGLTHRELDELPEAARSNP